MSTLNASAPLPVILDALGRAGWDSLDGRAGASCRAVLYALAGLLPHRSAVGLATANQVADGAGLKERATRTALNLLEEMGLITWTRGGIRDGVPVPGVIRVNKKPLLALLRSARAAMPDRLARRAAETAQRVAATLRRRTLANRAKMNAWRGRQTGDDKRRNPPPHAAFNASPSPYREVTGRPSAPPSTPTGTIINNRPAVGSRRAALRQAMAARQGQPC